ncbi:MAG: aminotransferase [Rhodobacteraceae bacterium]|nr:aminotransferase [Paracoccaceae bacterium]
MPHVPPITGSDPSLDAPVAPYDHWSLAPGLIYLNHGAFCPVPRALQQVQDRWRQRIESNPARFIMEELFDHLADAAQPLAAFVGTSADRLALVENASSGIATVLAGLDLGPGDRVLTTSHGYGAVRNQLTELARRRGIQPVEVALPCPVSDPIQILEALRPELDTGAALLIVDHVTSPTSTILPVAEIVALARDRGIPVLVDGSHAPGMLELDVDAIGAEWYVGNCHKWLCNPRGTAFLACADQAVQPRPQVISHAHGQGFPAEFRKIGSRDASAWLSVPDALDWHERMGGAALRARNTGLAAAAADRICEALGSACTAPKSMRGAMATIRMPGLPGTREAASALYRRLWDHEVELLCVPFADALWVRISTHAYNSLPEIDAVIAALQAASGDLQTGAT